MSEPKPMASLSSGLLARKGAAKPAMRPQGFGHISPAGLEDLGWNDMGFAPAAAGPVPVSEELPRHVPSSISALTPAPRPGEDAEAEAFEEEWDEEAEAEESAPPPVVEQQRAIAASFTKTPAIPAPSFDEPEAELGEPLPVEEPVDTPAPVVVPTAPKPVSKAAAKASKSKAAFTLRLDPERHLKLRLACAVTNRSAQQIVSGALDEFLKSLPELDAMAGTLPAKRG